MRPLLGLAAFLAVPAFCGGAPADPTPGPGYAAEIVRWDGAIFSGLARDGDKLLTTNLADGRLYRWRQESGFTVFGPSLPHGVDVIGDPTGPYDVNRFGDNYLVAQGWTPLHVDPGPSDHALIEVDNDEVVRVIADGFWNPFRFAVAGRSIYVVDAARNGIDQVSVDGELTPVFTFPRLRQTGQAMKSLSPTEFPATQSYEFDAVPTGIAAHGGRIYVSLFAGFPFLPGAGKIVSLAESAKAPTMRIESEGLNAPVDLAFDADGRLLVLEHGTYDQAVGFEPGSGRLISFDRTTGERRLLLDGLTRPVSVLVLDETRSVVCGLDGTIIFITKLNVPPQSRQGGTR